MNTEIKKNIVIIGGGFLGLNTARLLYQEVKAYAQIIVITESSDFTFYPHLYATLGKNTHDDAYIPYNHILHNEITVVHDTIISFSLEKKTVTGRETTYRGDYIIFAGGGIPFPLPEHACDMNGCHTQIGVKEQFLTFANEVARHLDSSETKQLHFHIVGGGITGIEFAGRLEYLFKNHQSIQAHIEIIERGPKILGRLNSEVGDFVRKYFNDHGIIIIENVNIDECKPLFDHSHENETTYILWTSGVQNNPLLSLFPKEVIEKVSKKALVNEYFEIQPTIYVGGDMAQSDHTGLAQGALKDSHIIANHIICSIKNADPLHDSTRIHLPKAFIIPISKYVGIFEMGNTRVYGLIPIILRFLANINFFFSFMRPRYILYHIFKLF